jgi:aryl-alcohol dehydrogenase-like predicted oxidoreductase
MDKRQLGFSDLWLSRFGLGTWAIGGSDFLFNIGDQDDRDSISAIHHALDLGISWFDTAPVYGLGHAEEILAKALRGKRDQVVLATKCGIVWEAGGQNIVGCLKSQSIRREVEQSLHRLQTEWIDLCQIHWPNPDVDLEEAWSTLTDLVREGKIRYVGASNFSVAQLQRVQRIHPVASLQPPYNLLQREIESELIDYCAAQKIGIIPYSPLRVGLLSGKFSLERWRNLPKDDWRLQYDDYRDQRFQINLVFIDKLGNIAARHCRPVSQIALAWVLRRPEITAAIVGARRPAQLEETIQAVNVRLSETDLSEIESLLAERDRNLAAAGVLEPQFVEPHHD